MTYDRVSDNKPGKSHTAEGASGMLVRLHELQTAHISAFVVKSAACRRLEQCLGALIARGESHSYSANTQSFARMRAVGLCGAFVRTRREHLVRSCRTHSAHDQSECGFCALPQDSHASAPVSRHPYTRTHGCLLKTSGLYFLKFVSQQIKSLRATRARGLDRKQPQHTVRSLYISYCVTKTKKRSLSR